ncbi:hypothetical protein ['Paenibacillus yunnanensis' Narsing Rao et al. 2020]|uniref:hypothetical protein n=1 Tax=Paenibacillus tengchongensis TaxID=2608684 RepID=UPI0016522E67|nr:hypothetical protein [Paenibacillus tengchongensis]
MNMTVHNLMGFNHQFFRPQPVATPKPSREQEQTQSFQDILNEKLKNVNSIRH